MRSAMGKKLDVLLGRKFKHTKFKPTVKLTLSRAAVLKNKRQDRLKVARSDVIQLLHLNHHENALVRVEQVIKDQNMVDVLIMVDGYCHLLLQMSDLIETEKDCPDDLKEAVSSLMYASSRCGEFPELREVREMLTSRYGKEFANGAMELRRNCGVNTRMIRKLSLQKPTLETRMNILQEIAAENGVVLKLADSSPASRMEEEESTRSARDDTVDEVMRFSESRKGKMKYRDVEDAAQAAAESAEHAAAAARAAVELSRGRSFDSDNPDSPNSRPRKILDFKNGKSKLQMKNEETEEGETSKSNTVAGDAGGYDSDGYTPSVKTNLVFDESENEIEKETSGFSSSSSSSSSSSKELGFDSANSESRFEKPPMSVRTRGVYGR